MDRPELCALVAALYRARADLAQDQDGCLEIIYPDGFRQKVGRSGPVEASYVCLQTRQGLVALDPLKGTTLWTRTDLSPQPGYGHFSGWQAACVSGCTITVISPPHFAQWSRSATSRCWRR